LLLLESRVVTLLYRSFFFFNFFQLKQLFLRGFVLVNRVSVRFFNERVRLGDIVHIGSPFVSMVRNNVLLKVSNKMVVRGLPRYLFVSYIFMFVLLCRYPRYMDVFFPVGFDVYRCLELL
jgi:ribosomal protein S4